MQPVSLSNKAKKTLEADYFKALHKRMELETKRTVLDNHIQAQQHQMDGLEAMLGYKPVMSSQEGGAE